MCTSKVWGDFIDGFVDLTKKYVLGSPLDEATTLGPMVKPEAADFVRKQIAVGTAGAAPRPISIPRASRATARARPTWRRRC